MFFVVVFDKSTKHFILKGPKGDDRIHVNKDEVAVSALYYCPQLGSLLVGYNFGALQLYNLMNLELVYTSPVCDEHIPISHFAIQVSIKKRRQIEKNKFDLRNLLMILELFVIFGLYTVQMRNAQLAYH